MQFTERQKIIIEIVKENEPISGDNIAKNLGLTRATLRSDLAILTMTGILDARPKVGYFYTGQSTEPLLYENLFECTIEKVMKNPVFLDQNATISEAITNLFINDVGSIFIIDDKKDLQGIVSRKDLLRASVNQGSKQNYPIAMVMTRMPNVVTALPEDRILDVSYSMSKYEVDSLPIIKNKKSLKVVGRISKTILLDYFTEEGIRIQKERC